MRKIAMIALLMAAGCSSKLEPEYTGCGTDENWVTFDDNEKFSTVDDTQAPLVTMPAAGASVAVAALKLTWQQDPNDVGAPDGDVPHDANECPQYTTGGLTTLHEPPISGNVYDLQFSVGGTLVHRLVTTLQEWAPDAADTGKFTGKTVSLKIYRMSVLRNDPKEGPFVGTAPFTFSVTP